MAKKSIELNKLENKFEIINENILNLNNIFEKNSIDAIVTNPPYKKKNTGIINEDEKKLISRHEITADLEDFIRVSKELLLEAIDDFEKDNIDSRECISEWKSKVAAETEMITKKALKKILNMRTGIASKFNRFLHEKYGVWIDGELRKGEFEATYQIGNLLNIKYEYNEKDYLDGRTFVYYVGAKSKRLAYPNACCMRKVISLGEELEYEEALPLMAVEFVRNSQYTVLPFPFKYLREYIKQC